MRASDPTDTRPWLKTIVALTLATRLAVVASVVLTHPAAWFFRSQGELGWLAQSILSGHGMSSPFGGDTGPTAFLTPGYPALIALIFRLFGVFTPAAALAIMLLQTLFATLTAAILIRIASREFGTLTANITGLAWAFGLPLIFLPLAFWDTCLTMLLIALALDLALICARRPTPKLWAEMGVVGGLTLLVNPSLTLILAAIFLWTLVTTRPFAWRGPIIATLLLLAIFAPWPIRNYRVLHAFIPLRSNLAFELWKGNHPGSIAIDDPIFYPVTNRAEYDSYATKGEVAFMRDKSIAANAWIAANPATFAFLTTQRIFLYWIGAGSKDPAPLLSVCEIVTTILSFLGLIFLARAGRLRLAILFALPLILFPLPYYLTHAELRFRILLEPVTLILSAYALTHLYALATSREASTHHEVVADLVEM